MSASPARVTRRSAAAAKAAQEAEEAVAPNGSHQNGNADAPATNGHANGAAKENGPAVADTWATTAGTGDRWSVWGLSGWAGRAAVLLGAVGLMVGAPTFANLLVFLLSKCNGSFAEFFAYFGAAFKQGGASGLFRAVADVWPTPFNPTAIKYVFSYMFVEAMLQLFVPGKEFRGPVTPRGNVPVYKANGVQRYFASMALFVVGWQLNIFDPADVIDHFAEILSTLNVFALVFCLFLMIKGLYFPSTTDAGSTGSVLFDFFWGTELYPRIGKYFDLKTWTNDSVSMMGWATICLCCAVKQYRDLGYVTNSMIVSVAILEVYLLKFFMWETGYWSSMDIAHDRAGFYICWGVLVWVPSVYCSPQLFLVNHPVQWSWPAAAAILAVGLASVYINYDADRQRQEFRRTEGKQPIWGKPPKMIVAKYKAGNGEEKTSLLLYSGWWGLARHFHYVPELLLAFCWSVTAGWGYFMPYFYFFFLVLLLTDRAFRDDTRCKAKYGKYWDEYCKAVPYKILPYVL
ncbi:sterol delta-7 reductase DWF5 [Hyaloraphidium curvatum]|nr:sterol delta-7 reductase DWF5 [Hyaloraphidium curvatum]